MVYTMSYGFMKLYNLLTFSKMMTYIALLV